MTLPAAAEDQRKVEELGAVQRQFRPRIASYISSVIIGIIMVGFGVFIGVLSVNIWAMLPDEFTDRTSTVVLGGIFTVLALGLVGMGAWVIAPLFQPKTSVVQHANGLAIYSNQKLAAVVPWDHIAHVMYWVARYRGGGARITRVNYAIQTSEQQRFLFSNGVRDVEELGENIQRGSISCHLGALLGRSPERQTSGVRNIAGHANRTQHRRR